MLASTYNAGSMLCADYGPLEWIGGHDSGVYRGRGNDGRYVALRFCAIDSDPARSALIEMVYTASLLQHPMLTPVAGCQSYAGGALCLVSEYVPGQALDRWLDDHGRPSLPLAVDFIRRLCLGLHAAHQRGLTHHALHPGNLMVLQPDTQPGGRIVAKLLDLGVPAFVRPWPPRAAALPYTAPELLESTAPSTPIITPRMNVYSAGALLHFLCTGAPPEREPDPASLRRLNPELPDELGQEIARSLAADPPARHGSAAELAAALARVESAWRISGVHRRENSQGELEPGQVLDAGGESHAVLHTRKERPPAAVSLQAGRSGVWNTSAEEPPATGRVHPHVLRPPTGSFPRLEIPESRRWAGGVVIACLLALYFAPLPSRPERAPVPRPAAEPAVLQPAPLATLAPPAPASRPIELPLAAPATVQSAPPMAIERAPGPTVAMHEPVAAPVSSKRQRSRPRALAVEQPTAAGTLEPRTAPFIPPAPLPASTPSPVTPPKPIERQPRVASEVEATHGSQPAAAGDSTAAREVQVAEINVRGSLTVSVVRRAIERIRPMLTQCYRRHSKPGHAALPTLQVSATIDEVGRVRSPNVAGGNLPALNECVVKATSKMVSDAPDTGTVRASWRLSL